jgi:hypothetical protein
MAGAALAANLATVRNILSMVISNPREDSRFRGDDVLILFHTTIVIPTKAGILFPALELYYQGVKPKRNRIHE